MDWRKRMKIMKYILICGNIFFIACGGFIVYCNITDITVQILLVGIFMALCFMNLGSYFYFREQFVVLSSQICHYSENIMHGNSIQKIWNKETITSKVVMELEKMKKVIAFQIAESKKEKKVAYYKK